MNILTRWAKFNLVGVIGMAVQLSALTLLSRALPSHYLYAAAAALELTLLHNFLWHRRYTWRDRPTAWPRQLLRFHLSNGLISLAGNLALMRLLVHTTHLPLLVSNLIAILCCSIANFSLSHKWTFPSALVLVPEIGPGFSPDIQSRHHSGL